MPLLFDGLTLLLVGLAACTDLTRRQIPNALTLPAAAAGLALNLAWRGPEGLGLAALGWLLGVGLLVVPFLLRGIGAGDVKLLAAVGALQGPMFVLMTFVCGAIAAGLVAIVLLRLNGQLGLTLQSVALFRFLPGPVGTMITTGRVPYGPAIAFGTVVVLTLGLV